MGRAKSYDEEEVLEKALHCFWNHGYQNTSIRLLEKEMGINQFSIYASFKSKSQLYQRILKRYIDFLNKKYLHKMRSESCNLKEIEQFLIAFGKDMKSGEIPSCCLMVRSILNYKDFDNQIKKVIDDFIQMISSLYKQALVNNNNKHSTNKNTSTKTDVDYLVGLTQSISIMNQHMTSKQLVTYIKNSVGKLN